MNQKEKELKKKENEIEAKQHALLSKLMAIHENNPNG